MPSNLHILLVEDNEGDVEMTLNALDDTQPACTVSVAHDGLEALDYLHRRGEFSNASTPHFILLDLNMPRMDGKRFLEAVKQEVAFKAIPVIMFTSSKSPMDILECYERHASCYIVKPFSGKEYATILKQVVQFWGVLSQLPSQSMTLKRPV